MRYLLLGAVLTAALATSAASAGDMTLAVCSPSGLGGTFKLVPGSQGAGNIVYKLRVLNRSDSACLFPARPSLRLLDSRGRALPTHASFPKTQIATVTITPGHAAIATARFSPDIPSGGEPQKGPCEKVAHKLRVGLRSGSTITVPVKPPTTVCGHGSMTFRAIHQGS